MRPVASVCHLLVAADAPSNTLQLGVADLPKLQLRHRFHSVTLRDQLTAVANKEAIISWERLQDLSRSFVWLTGMTTILTCGNEPLSEAALLSYLSSEAEATSGGHHLLQDMALDSSSADVFVDDAVLQMDIIYGHADQRQLAGEGRFAQQVVCQEQVETIIMWLTQMLT